MSTRPREPQLDTYLLRVLHTLLIERSVSRTAIRLGQSQPAISNLLKRLREITGDAILVRGKNGMVQTERGEELLALARTGLDVMEKLAAPLAEFNPLTTGRVFRLGTPDYLNALLIPTLIERIRQEAPAAGLVVQSLNSGFDYAAALESGELDAVIGNWPAPPEHLHLTQLFDDEVVCVVHRDHPVIRKGLTLKTYLEMPHLVPTPYTAGHRSVIDAALAEHGLRRNLQIAIPYFGLVPDVLARTDLIFSTGRQLAEHFSKRWPVAVLPMPLEIPKMRFYLLWHARARQAPDVQWLRQLIVGTMPLLAPTGK